MWVNLGGKENGRARNEKRVGKGRKMLPIILMEVESEQRRKGKCDV